MLTAKQQAAFVAFVPLAVAAERSTGFPAEITVSQWATESAWGDKESGKFNMFGLTRAVCPDRPQWWVATEERMTAKQLAEMDPEEKARVHHMKDLGDGYFRVDLERRFPCFDSLEQAVGAYVGLITTGPRYASAWKAYGLDHDMDRLIDGIARAGYATGAGYAALLKQIAHEGRVQIAVQGERARLVLFAGKL